MKAIVTLYKIINNLETITEDYTHLHVFFLTEIQPDRKETGYTALIPNSYPDKGLLFGIAQ